jgi:hypothetical protein
MLGRHVQRIEAVPLVLDLRPLDDRDSHAGEDAFHTIAHQRQRMTVTEWWSSPGQGDVHGAHSSRSVALLGLRLIRRPARFDALLELVGPTADGSLVVGRGAGNELHPPGHDAVLSPEIPVPDRLRVSGGGCL